MGLTPKKHGSSLRNFSSRLGRGGLHTLLCGWKKHITACWLKRMAKIVCWKLPATPLVGFSNSLPAAYSYVITATLSLGQNNPSFTSSVQVSLYFPFPLRGLFPGWVTSSKIKPPNRIIQLEGSKLCKRKRFESPINSILLLHILKHIYLFIYLSVYLSKVITM